MKRQPLLLTAKKCSLTTIRICYKHLIRKGDDTISAVHHYDDLVPTEINALAAGILIALFLFFIALIVVCIIANWKIYKKLGLEPWACLIPFYNNYVLFARFYSSGWEFLTTLIPLYGVYRAVKLQIDVAHAFGQSDGFACGLIFLYPIFAMILAFGHYQVVATSTPDANVGA